MIRSNEAASDRIWCWLIGLGLLAFAVTALLGLQKAMYWGGDDADYALLAQSLRSFRYVDMFDVARPPHTRYPPLYPAILSVWGGLTGDRLSVMAALNIVFMVGALGLVVHLVWVHTSARAAAGAVLLFGVNPHMLEYAGRLLSEAPALFLGTSVVWLADRRPKRVGLAIACAVLCALTRSAGVAAIGGLGLYWLLQRRWWPVVALSIASAVFVGGWLLWIMQPMADPTSAYTSRFTAYVQPDVPFWKTIGASLIAKASALWGSQIPEALGLPLWSGTKWDNLAWVPLSTAAVAVGLWRIGRTVPSAGLVLIAYALVLAAWPFLELRLLVPFVPLLLLAAVVGSGRIARMLRPAWERGATIAVALLLVVCGAWRSSRSFGCDGSIYGEASCATEAQLGLGQAISHIGEHVPQDAVIMVLRGEVTHYYTGNLTVQWPRSRDVRAVGSDTILAVTKPDYILVTNAMSVRLAGVSRLINDVCGRLGVEFVAPPHTLLVKVHPPDEPPASNACALAEEYFPEPENVQGRR